MKNSVCPILAVVLCAAHLGHATQLGLSADPMGDAWNRGDVGSAHAIWDTFSGTSFLNDAAGSFSGVMLPELDQSTVFTNFAMGAGLYKTLSSTLSPTPADNDVLFPGGNGVSFTLTGEVGFSIHGFMLQIKRAGSTGGLATNFSPTLSINASGPIGFDSVYTVSGGGDTSSDSGSWSVTTWVWGASLAGIPDAGSNTFGVSFSNAGLQRGIDGLAVDVGSVAPQAVPEPATWAVLACGLAFMLLVHRRRGQIASGHQKMAIRR